MSIRGYIEMLKRTERCFECEKRFIKSKLRFVGDQWYCPDCFDKYFGVCSYCDDIFPIDDLKGHNQQFYCEICFDENFDECEHCGYVGSMDDIYFVEAYDGHICSNCYSTLYFYCESCEQDISVELPQYELSGIYVCQTCYMTDEASGKGLLFLLNDFIEFERRSPLPERTIAIWITRLLQKKWRCPCSDGNHRCGTNCPRELDSCIGIGYWQYIRETNRKFVRFYLIRKLSEILTELGSSITLLSLMDNPKIC